MEPRMIPVDRIRILEGHNARDDVGDVSDLAATIETLGVLQALTVVELGAEDGQPLYGLIVGERRYTAARQAGLAEVPCMVQDLDERQRVTAMLVENLQREDLGVLQEARGIKRLADMGLSQREIARQLGRGQSHVSKRLALLTLPAEIQAAIDRPRDAGGITVADALELTKLAEHPARQAKAFADSRGFYGGVAGTVKTHLAELARERAKAEARARLMSAGVRIHKERDYYSWTGTRERPLAGQSREHEYAATELTVEAHQGEPCHAAVIDREGKVIYVCEDPARHPEVDRGTAAAVVQAREQQEQQREGNRLRREAARGRREAIERVLAGANSSILPFAARQVTAHWRHEESKQACALLGLQPVEEHGPYGTHRDYRAALSGYAGGSMAAAIRALLALALAPGEASVSSTWGHTTELDKRHMEVLVAAGYEPNESDRKHLTDEPGRREAGDDERTCRSCGDVGDELREDGRTWVEDPEGLGDLCSGCLPELEEEGQAAEELGEQVRAS